jgi:predicted phosphoadenosine phosphosulfate sulfurtransferase
LKIQTAGNVFDVALARFKWIYNEFENVIVNVSGGKDSTVVMHLALLAAEEAGRLPVNVRFIDQEAEWQSVIDYVRYAMHLPNVRPYWLQVPFEIFNATSTAQEWLYAWEPGADWIRPKEPDSIHENTFGTVRFADLFEAHTNALWGSAPAVHIAGVRCQESPSRRVGLTTFATYKWVTWGNHSNKRRPHYTLYPIYDWNYTDVWKAIHEHGWKYCTLYDSMYQHGVPLAQMRVSNVHHATAVKSLYYLQEIEADTWDRVVSRVRGVNTVAHLQKGFFMPSELPPMFSDWREYRDHILEHLVTDDIRREEMRARYAKMEKAFHPVVHHEMLRCQIKAILTNDWWGVAEETFTAGNMKYLVRRMEKDKIANDIAMEKHALERAGVA